MSVPLTYLFQDAGRILCDKVFFARFSLAAARELDACLIGILLDQIPTQSNQCRLRIELLYPDCSTRAPIMQPSYLLIPLKYF